MKGNKVLILALAILLVLPSLLFAQAATEQKESVMRLAWWGNPTRDERTYKAVELFTEKNVRSIRPGYGLHTRYLPVVLGKTAKEDYAKGTPLSWEMV